MSDSDSLVIEDEQYVCLEAAGRIEGPKLYGYEEFEIDLPAGARELRVLLCYEGDKLYVSLFGPRGYRGTVMNPDATGEVTLEAVCAAERASRGIVAGGLETGRWRVLIDHGPDLKASNYSLSISYLPSRETTDASSKTAPREMAAGETAVPPPHALNRPPGWYRGELHLHSSESDGKASAAEVARAVEEIGLDFASLTDHYTVSGWHHMRRALTGRTLLVRGCEVTSRRGHANVHGVSTPIDPHADRTGWTLRDVAAAIHAQGGIFCVNHPFSGVLGWRAREVPWDEVDAMEIIHALEGPGTNLQLGLWDHLLRLGHRVVGIAGTDSHHPTRGAHSLGRLTNWVYAASLTEEGLIEGIRAGRVLATYGPFVELTAVPGPELPPGRQSEAGAGADGRTRYGLWERVPTVKAKEGLNLEVRVNSNEAVRVFLLKDGLPFSHGWVNPAEDGVAVYRVYDRDAGPCYYRVEIHGAFPEQEQASWKVNGWRDYRSLLSATNPVFVGD
ncbi:MAG: hypothetical protein GVY23_02835 [Spirochaetes bacterium]|jgi:hypothetical protein|nr:hypothetical protein [Spirochaetota bacterium]